MDLITDAEVAAALGVAVDANITRIVKFAHRYVYRKTGRTFERKERTIYVPGYGPNVNYVFLDEAPIWSVAEVRIDSTGILDAATAITDLTVFAFESGREDFRLLYLDGYFPEGTRVAMVRFTAGYEAAGTAGANAKVPDDLREEMILECARRWKRGTAEEFAAASLGDFSYTRREEKESPFVQMVNAYKGPRA